MFGIFIKHTLITTYNTFFLSTITIFKLSSVHAIQAFDDSGDRIYAEYAVMNIIKKSVMKVVGRFFFDDVSKKIHSIDFFFLFIFIKTRELICLLLLEELFFVFSFCKNNSDTNNMSANEYSLNGTKLA